MISGEVRELAPQPQLAWMVGLSWAPDGRSIALTGVDEKGRSGIFRLDTHTGDLSSIVVPIPLTYEGAFWSPDGNRIYYRPLNQGIQEREIASGKERVVVSGSGANGPFSLSPDGRWIAWYDRSTLQSIVVIRVEDGQSREVFRTSDGGLDVIPMPWTPDSSAVLVRKYLGTSGGSELWLVPVNGGVPRKLDIDLTGAIGGQLGKIRLSPDGKRLAYVVGKSYRSETWVLENFLPALKAGR
jgi:Tol biopolymer transport system component